jgi:ATP-dependent helicase/nuclease subunit B
MPAKTASSVKSLRMNGLISNEEEIRSAMEKDNAGVFVPKYSDKSQDYVDKQLFEQIFDKIEDLIKEMGKNIHEGKFAADPTDGISINACTYCDFKSVCRSADNPHKKAVKYTRDEIKELLKKGGEENGV